MTTSRLAIHRLIAVLVPLLACVGVLLLSAAPTDAAGHRYDLPSASPSTSMTAVARLSLHTARTDAWSARASATSYVAARSSSAAEDPGQILFRADTRGPEDIFQNGFEPKGSNMDLLEHATSNPADSGYVSTTKSLRAAQEFDLGEPGYIYRLRGSGIDVNTALGPQSPYPWEEEVAIPGSVPGTAIHGAWSPAGEWMTNPFAVP